MIFQKSSIHLISQKNNNSKINNTTFESKERNQAYISPILETKMVRRNINISGANNFLKSYDSGLSDYLKEVRNRKDEAGSNKKKGSYDFTNEVDNKDDLKDSWLNGRSKKRQIGPYKNDTSEAFIMGYSPKEKTARERIGENINNS